MRARTRTWIVMLALVTALASMLMPAPASAACYKCKFTPFLGMRCEHTGGVGKTGCNDSQVCGLYGTPCGGTSGGGAHDPLHPEP
jgi:hypothetical protein